MQFTNTSKAAAFFMLGLIMLAGVAEGVGQIEEFTVVAVIQFVGFALAGFACMVLGASYGQEVDAE